MRVADIFGLRHRILIEPGLPPLIQEPGLAKGWDTAMALPALHRLASELTDMPRRDHPLAPLCEPGDVIVHIDTEKQWPSTMQMISLYSLEHLDESLSQSVLASLFAHYPVIRRNYDFLPEELIESALPEVEAPEDMRRLVRLERVTIHAVSESSTPYLGFELSCSWDEEHGLGLLSYGSEVLEVGTADVSVDRGQALEHRARVLAALSGAQ